MKYSLTRALAEIKLLQKRFYSEVSDLNLVAVKHGIILRKPYSSQKPEDFSKKAVSNNQSVCDLEKRITMIKKKIAEANSTVKVTIGKREMTIQDALIEKAMLPLKQTRLDQYKRLLRSAREQFELAQSENDTRIRERVRDAKDAITEQQAKEEIEISRAVSMVDPLELSKVIEALEAEIMEFESNVDFALSEVNSTNFIEID